jgi:hypothetical protein
VRISITDDASAAIVDYYGELRRLSRDRALPVTARSLETIIRLATAACKVQLQARGISGWSERMWEGSCLMLHARRNYPLTIELGNREF